MKYFKTILYSIMMLIMTGLLVNITENPYFNFRLFNDSFLNEQLNYQLSGLVLASISLIILYLFADDVRLDYLNFSRQGKMKPVSFLGIKEEGKWEEDGWSYGLIMLSIMGVTSFIGVYRLGFNFTLLNSVLAIVFALTNAFTEEVIFRLSYVTMGDNESLPSAYGLIMGSVVFGIIHYWGIMPNGIFGVLISSLLGYFLAKSIQETKGFYWSFMLHFVLDVIIMMFLFNAQR